MIEAERKFRLSKRQRQTIASKIQSKYGPRTTIHQSDTVFLAGIDSFATFIPGMPVMRLRSAHDTVTLTYKRHLNDAGDSIEHELGISSAETMQAILREIDYRPVTKVDKQRIEFKDGSVTLALDTVEGLGDFLEIEILTSDVRKLEAIEKEIMTIAAEYGLTETDIEPRKYDQMLTALKKKRT